MVYTCHSAVTKAVEGRKGAFKRYIEVGMSRQQEQGVDGHAVSSGSTLQWVLVFISFLFIVLDPMKNYCSHLE